MSLANAIQSDDTGNQGSPIDLVHLAKYTHGNKELEAEVLELFLHQSEQYLDKLKNSSTEKDWKEAAHTIKGSAKGIGAWQVAKKAEAVEKIDYSLVRDSKATLIESLESSMSKAKGYIREILA